MTDIYVLFQPDDYERCQIFAEEVVDKTSDYYEDRGQVDRLKAIRQHRESKLGEIITHRHLHERGFDVEPPDFTVYANGRKSWDSDLLVHLPGWDLQLAVKSQWVLKEKKYGASWLFGYGNIDGKQSLADRDKLFDLQHQDNVLIVPTTICTEGCAIRGAIKAKDVMQEVERSLPIAPALKDSKRVLYGTYITNGLSEEQRWRWPFDRLDHYQEALSRLPQEALLFQPTHL